MRHSSGWGRVLAAGAVLGVLLRTLVAGLRAHYLSWHPCDWLLQDAVSRTLEIRGIDPDTASIVIRATTVELPEVQATIERHNTPLSCLLSWAGTNILP